MRRPSVILAVMIYVRCVSVSATPPGCSSHCLTWDQKGDLPPARSGHSMVYDSYRGVAVLFGGYGSEIFGDTWEWDGAQWTLRACSGPSPREDHSMVYDSIRRITVLFGGYAGGTGENGETWEWDGVTWTPRSVPGPGARAGHAMAFDEARGVAVLFGGWLDDHALGDTWEWDGVAWVQVAASGPSPRTGHAMVYDRLRGATFLYGGNSSPPDAESVWEWNGTEWTEHRPGNSSRPPGNYSDTWVYDTERGVSTFLGATFCEGELPCLRVWEWDGVAWAVRDDRVLPWGPEATAAVYDDRTRRVVMFGGITWGENVATYVPTDDTWELTETGWRLVDRGSPARRWGHAMTYDSQRHVTVLFGGNATSYNAVGRLTWEWDGTNWFFHNAPGPSPRVDAAMVFDEARSVAVLFGGYYWDDDVWEWTGSEWRSHDVPGPTARRGHAMAYDSARGVTVLFGGGDSETWEWDGSDWQFRTAEGPSARSGHAMAYDAARGVTVLFGGGDSYSPLGDTWEWDGTVWTPRATDGPPPRTAHAMVFDRARGRTVLFGGAGCWPSEVCGDTWEWDGQVWTLVGLVGPPPRMDHAMAYDSVRDVTVLFGGRYPYLDDTWEFEPGPSNDADSDGVANECDQCPLTPPGHGAAKEGCARADQNLDGFVDLHDFAAYQNCVTDGPLPSGCERFEMNGYGDIWGPFGDFPEILRTWTGPGQ